MSPKLKFYSTLSFLFVALIAIVTAGLWFYFVHVIGTYYSLREHHVQLRQSEALQHTLIRMRAAVNTREEDIVQIRSALYRPGKVDLSAHLKYLTMVEELSVNQGLTRIKLTPSGEATAGDIFGTKFSFSTNGTYDQIIKFLSMLEQLPIFTIVEQAQISGSGETLLLNVTIAVATIQ